MATHKSLPTTYYVWRRIVSIDPGYEGIVGISVYDPNKDDTGSSYEILLETTDFDEAQSLTVKLQALDPRQSGDD